MKVIHKLTKEQMEIVKDYGVVCLLKGKEYNTVGFHKTSDKYICLKSNLIYLDNQLKLL